MKKACLILMMALSVNPVLAGTSFHLPNNTWQLISLPADPVSQNTVGDIFSDDLPETGYGTTWALFSLSLLPFL